MISTNNVLGVPGVSELLILPVAHDTRLLMLLHPVAQTSVVCSPGPSR